MIFIICIVTFVVLYYFGYVWKINWIQDLTAEEVKNSVTYRNSKSQKIGKIPPVYPNGWFGLLDSLALKKGQVKHVPAIGQNFAVFRTESGIVRILNAYCPHLGANMAEGGQVKGENLECPFHLWRFCGKTGDCTGIPYSKKVPHNAKTKVWDCVEANGVIFVWYHAESASPDWWPKSIEKIKNGTWKYQGRNEFRFNCHIQEIAENGADWAHLETLHGPLLLIGRFLSKFVRHSWSDAAWSSNLNSAIETKNDDNENVNDRVNNNANKNDKHRATSVLKHRILVLDKYEYVRLNVIANQIGPAYVELSLDTCLGPLCIVQTVTPIEPLTQKVCHLIFSPTLLAPYARLVFIGECIQFVRDAKIWNHKKYLGSPILLKEERPVNAYRRWYRQFYSVNSPTYDSCRDSLDW